MTNSRIIYIELLKMAQAVGFKVDYKFANHNILAKELGDFLNNDRCEVLKNHIYYRDLFTSSPYPVGYKKRV